MVDYKPLARDIRETCEGGNSLFASEQSLAPFLSFSPSMSSFIKPQKIDMIDIQEYTFLEQESLNLSYSLFCLAYHAFLSNTASLQYSFSNATLSHEDDSCPVLELCRSGRDRLHEKIFFRRA